MLPNLSKLCVVDAKYRNLLLESAQDEHRRAVKMFNKDKDANWQLPQNSRRPPRTDADIQKLREKRTMTIIKEATNVEVVRDWIAQDFSAVPLPPPKLLFSYLRVAVPMSLQQPPNDAFPIAVPYEKEDVKDNADVIDAASESYVAGLSDDNEAQILVGTWTQQEDEESGYDAPHRIIDQHLLAHVGLKDIFAWLEINPSTKMIERAYRDKFTRKLYNLVTSAPRTPEPVFLTRTVRQARRVPDAWFKRLTSRKMRPGDAILSPVFLSCSLLSPEFNWFAHGGPEHATAGERDVEEECCIVNFAVAKGVPLLPLGDFASNVDHAHEVEVLLPPGVEFVLTEVSSAVELEGGGEISAVNFLVRVPDPTKALAEVEAQAQQKANEALKREREE